MYVNWCVFIIVEMHIVELQISAVEKPGCLRIHSCFTFTLIKHDTQH